MLKAGLAWSSGVLPVATAAAHVFRARRVVRFARLSVPENLDGRSGGTCPSDEGSGGAAPPLPATRSVSIGVP